MTRRRISCWVGTMTHTTTNTTTNTGTASATSGRFRQAVGFGAGIVATLTAGIVLAATAADAGSIGADEATFVPITPCRLFDTRPAPDNVGERATPLGADDTHIQQVTGTNGNCVIPTDATAVALNATAVGATAPSFGTFYPADASLPGSSNLNYGPGQAATPNKVDVKLSADGKLAIFNKFGSVDMLADVTGYYTSSGLAGLEARRPSVYAEAVDTTSAPAITTDETSVISLDVDADVVGEIVAHYDVTAAGFGGEPDLRCALVQAGETVDWSNSQIWTANGGGGADNGTLSGTRTFRYDPNGPTTSNIDLRLKCRRYGTGGVNILNASVVATLIPD